MTMKRMCAIAVSAIVLMTACGKSEQQKQAEEAAKQAEAAAKQAEQAAKTTEQAAQGATKGLEAMAKSLEAMANGNKDVKVDPVKFQDLIAALPQLDGWQQEKPTGERMTSPFATANAKATYTRGDSNIRVEIVDSAFNQLLLTPIAMFLQVGYSQESTSGYEKSATVNGQPGWEKWNSDSKSGEVNALVGKRFLVTINGSGIDDTKPLQEAANRIDFNRLAALK
jgi:hypothetical protein